MLRQRPSSISISAGIVPASAIPPRPPRVWCETFAGRLCDAVEEHPAYQRSPRTRVLVKYASSLGCLTCTPLSFLMVAIAFAQLTCSPLAHISISHTPKSSPLIACWSHPFFSSPPHQGGNKTATTHHFLASSFPSPGLAFCQSLLCPLTSTS
jgi:hypothetical protein